ncbi:ferrochelatase [Hoyosella subflava]|uniref:Coproporphyrin III ferrochelatase n=1 Tax=Hoyosella subflava (strain DSM 45089 / JCM 17490 / NBRC 109087 / DQS3-9A1) TaxID=443218 RepID=F6ENA1_HOYSD|nr:ferrochelatase [Hoyosella subflava]AEF40372.1 Ferrochelatase [Hoyosella subflava DQS3-9A1]
MSSGGYDALLLLSFGGPEKPSDVRPFLENVTRGRNVPSARLDEVEQHYLHFGGVSPINELNRQIIAAVKKELDAAGLDLPVYFGNRNWHPLAEDTVEEMADAGVDRALVFPTSAWGGYSGCRQYHEDIARARASVAENGNEARNAPELVKMRHYFDHPLLVDAFADAIRRARDELPPSLRNGARLVFTAHSIPVAADESAGVPSEGGHLYSRQVREAARLCAEASGVDEYDVVWQSRSGPAHIPWLEPDICDHLESLAEAGEKAVIVCPVGFVSDHLEVVWDLDTEAKEKAAELGMGFARAATPGTDPRFAKLVVELVSEAIGLAVPRRLGTEPSRGTAVNGSPCLPGCCQVRRRVSATQA